MKIFKNYRNLEDDLHYFYGDDSDHLGKKKIAKIIAYNFQTFDDVEDCYGYLRYVISHDAIIHELYDRENPYSIFYLIDEIYHFLKTVTFPVLKEAQKQEMVHHFKEIVDGFAEYILNPTKELDKILEKYLAMYTPKHDIGKTAADDLEDSLYTIAETAEILKVSRQTVYNYIEQGKLKPVRLSEKKQRISRDQIAMILGQNY